MPNRLPAVDAYIARAQPFAQPILRHLRDTIHSAVPEVEEAIKWSMPFFLVNGVILGNMAGFKAHCSFGLWGAGMDKALREDGVSASQNMGSFGKITSLDDLPAPAVLAQQIRRAADLVRNGTRTRSIQRVAKPARTAPETPDALAQALKQNKAAAQKFSEMSPSCRREYAEWIAGAKREDTRSKRVATALEWIADGKGRNWKYERPA